LRGSDDRAGGGARPRPGGAERPRPRRGRRSRIDGDAREAGAYVIGTGRATGRETALDFGAHEFVDLDNDTLEEVGGVDLVFDILGGDIQKRSAGLVRAGGTLVTITGPPEARPADGPAIDFVVVSDRAQLSEIVQRVRDGRLRTNIGNVATLDDAVAALNPTKRVKGKTIIHVRPKGLGTPKRARLSDPAGERTINEGTLP
jgi:D-arabinose 1-dehydrogenase-like Zn-dependent alcohol dehydrogenase